jgi:peptidoglycan-N-acetylglucosamine deacetylase
LLALLALAVVLPGCGSSSPPEEAELSQPAEPSQPEPSSTTEPVPSVEEAWAAAVAQDPSPTLATPGETMEFGHRIALTFDDGPDPVTTPAILDILRDNHLKATFFVIGARAEQYPELVERIVSEGHALANHTYYHRDLTKLTPDLVLTELQDTQAAIDRALGSHPQITLFRPPCGAPYNTETDKLPAFQEEMREQHMYPVMWTIDSRDWALQDQPESIVDNLIQNTPPGGGVILLHDTQPQTADALPGIIDSYTAANFEFTGVRDLLAQKYGLDPEGVEPNLDTLQHGSTPEHGVSGDNFPGDLASLAECIT